MSSRLSMVVGVTLSVVASTGVPKTLTVCFTPATANGQCSTGLVSDCTITLCCMLWKPCDETVTV